MKLCIVTPKVVLNDGQGRVNYEVVWEAIRRNHQITLVTQAVAPDLADHPQITWIQPQPASYPTQLLKDLQVSYHNWRWLKQHEQEFDLIQIDGAFTIAPADVNVVHFVHSAWLKSPVHVSRSRRDFYGLYQWIYTSVHARREKQAFQQAKQLVTVSQRVKQELLDLGIPEDRISVIYNGVDTQEFEVRSADQITNRKSLGLPTEAPLALFIGDLKTNRKNLDTVFKALQSIPQTHLVVVGEAEGSPYPGLAQDLKIDHQVHFLGRRSDIPQVMQACDFFVFPSRYEPFGMVVTEAMATGLPVIISTSTGAAEILGSDCSFVFEAEDVRSVQTAMDKLSHQPELRHHMGQAARSIAEQHTWRHKAIDYLTLYEAQAQ